MADNRTTFNLANSKDEMDIFKRLTLTYEREKSAPAATEDSIFDGCAKELQEMFQRKDEMDRPASLTVFSRVVEVYEQEKAKPGYSIQSSFTRIRAELKDLFSL